MTDTISRFKSEYQEYHGISRARRVEQCRVLGLLRTHANKDLLSVAPNDLKSFLRARQGTGVCAETIYKELYMIKPFYQWAFDAGLIDIDDLAKLRAVSGPRRKKPSPKPYTRKQIKQLWAELGAEYPRVPRKHTLSRWRNGTCSWLRVRRHAHHLQFEAIIALALYGGLRLNEIYTTTIADMEPTNDYVVVRSRKNRSGQPEPRAVPMIRPLAQALEAWFVLREEIGPTHDFPWLRLHGKGYAEPLGYDTFRKKLGDLGSGWEYHRLRHTAATEMLRAKMPIERVQQILGHSTIQQTLAYAKIMTDDLCEAASEVEDELERVIGPKQTNGYREPVSLR